MEIVQQRHADQRAVIVLDDLQWRSSNTNHRTSGAEPWWLLGSPSEADYPDAVSLDPTARDVLVIVGVALGALALLLAAVGLVNIRRMKRDYLLLQSGDDQQSFVAAAARTTERVQGLSEQVAGFSIALEQTRSELSDALRHVSVVRYDAFGDLGGRLSFSAALLDDSGDGLVLTSIHGRTETRSYIKGVKSGTGDAALSPEELQAVSYALRGVAA